MQTNTIVVAAALGLAACGGEAGSSTCALDAAFSGALSASTQGDPACLTQFSSDDIDGAYLFLDGPIETVEIDIQGVERGVTASDLPAELTVTARDGGGTWSGGCIADITEHELIGPAELGEEYRAAGTVTCSVPLTSEVGGDPLNAERFEFAITPTWP